MSLINRQNQEDEWGDPIPNRQVVTKPQRPPAATENSPVVMPRQMPIIGQSLKVNTGKPPVEEGGGILEKLPPHDIASEEACIAAALVDNFAFAELVSIVQEEDFFREKNAMIWNAMGTLFKRGEALNTVTVSSELGRSNLLAEVGGSGYLMRLVDELPTTVGAEWYAKNVAIAAQNRRSISAAGMIAKMGYEGCSVADWEERYAKMVQILQAVPSQFTRSRIRSAKEIMDESEDGIVKWIDDPTMRNGYITGYWGLDEILDGVENGRFYILAGLPGSGKSLVAMHLAIRFAQGNKLQRPLKVLYISAEMSGNQIAKRAVFAKLGIDRKQAKLDGTVIMPDLNRRVKETMHWWRELSISIDDKGPWGWDAVKMRVRQAWMRGLADVVFIDHIDLIGDMKDENRVAVVSEITRDCKAMAIEFNIPVIALSQMNRSAVGRDDKWPLLTDMRSSGSKEQDTDVVIAVHRPAYFKRDLDKADPLHHQLYLCVLKNRDGELGEIELYTDLSKGTIMETLYTHVDITDGTP